MRTIANCFLRATGWTTRGERPPFPKFVLIAAPHTSNWDLLFVLLFAMVFRLEIHWLGKHTLFRWPLGVVLRRLGGISVDRRAPRGFAEEAAQRFRDTERLVLVVPPEGSRRPREYWKSGFYQIARAARVPIVASFLDYERRIAGFGPTLKPGGDVRSDMTILREFYADVRGRWPDKFLPPRLREEDEERRDASSG